MPVRRLLQSINPLNYALGVNVISTLYCFIITSAFLDVIVSCLSSCRTRATSRFQQHFTSPRIKHALLVGGTNRRRVMSLLKSSCDVVVGTPGRVLDFMENGFLDCCAVRLLVSEMFCCFVFSCVAARVVVPRSGPTCYILGVSVCAAAQLAGAVLVESWGYSNTPLRAE